jgi:hypothetical protein
VFEIAHVYWECILTGLGAFGFINDLDLDLELTNLDQLGRLSQPPLYCPKSHHDGPS